MIEIYINGQKADYFGSITIKKDNPLFAKPNIEPTEHTYTLTLPTTATNARIFSLVQHTFATPATLQARIEIDSIPVLNGSCVVQSWNESGYSVYFNGKDPNVNVKRLLADTATLQDVITIADTTKNDAGVYLTENGRACIVKGYASGYAYKDEQLRVLGIESNLAFDNNYLIRQIASAYGVEIDTLPSVYVMQLGKADSYVKTINNQISYWTRIQSSIPRITPKEYLCNIAFAFGKRLEVDYRLNKIKFVDLLAVSGDNIIADITNISYGSQLVGLIDYTEIKPYEYQDIEGEKQIATYSKEFGFFFGEQNDEEKKQSFFTNRFSLPKPLANSDFADTIVLPSHYEEDDERLENIALVDFVNDGIYSYLKEFTPITEGYEVYNLVNAKGVTIKISHRLNPLKFVATKYYKQNFINGMPFFIKSINFKPDGESEIEGYLV
jgi:hypothetical protein